MKVSEIIRNRRIELGMTQQDVADAIGVTKATVSRWETGNIKNMNRENIEKLSRLLDIPPSVLLDWDTFDEERLRRGQLIAELTTLATVADIDNVEIVIDILRRLEKK